MDRNLRRIQLVASHFGELQGLRVVLVGSVFTLVFGAYVMAPPAEGSWGIWIALAGSFAVVVPCHLALDRYYASRVGRVMPRPSRDRFWRAGALGPLAVLLGVVLKLPPLAVAFPFLACFSLWIVVRDWPFRIHHLAGFAAALFATVLLLTQAAAASPDLSVAAAFLLVGVAYVPAGFLDHRLLMSVMHEAGPEAVADAARRD